MSVKQTKYVLMNLFFVTVLAACGDDEAGNSSANQGATTADAPASAKMEMSGNDNPAMKSQVMAIEDNGVVYQDEIYKNWPAAESD